VPGTSDIFAAEKANVAPGHPDPSGVVRDQVLYRSKDAEVAARPARFAGDRMDVELPGDFDVSAGDAARLLVTAPRPAAPEAPAPPPARAQETASPAPSTPPERGAVEPGGSGDFEVSDPKAEQAREKQMFSLSREEEPQATPAAPMPVDDPAEGEGMDAAIDDELHAQTEAVANLEVDEDEDGDLPVESDSKKGAKGFGRGLGSLSL